MTIFDALKRIFSTGLIVTDVKRDTIKVIDTQRSQAYTHSRNKTFFDKLHKNRTYQSSLTQNYAINRLALYRDYDMMDADPLISAILDIYVFESLTKNQYGDIIKVSSQDQQIKQVIQQLFYQRLNCQFNLNIWFRNFVKYGDFFLALRLDQKLGIIGCQPISPYDIQRIQDDINRPNQYYFKFTAGGNEMIQNYQIAHFRLMNDSNFLPYGRSTLEAGRRIWKNLSLMLDAMMIQRIMRAPERRVFKIDVGNIQPQAVPGYMQDIIKKMKKVPYKDPQTGQINLKYNIQNLLQDFFLPVQGNQDGSSIQTLSGMQNSFIQDIQFMKSYMLAAFKVPKAFLAFQEGIQSKCFAPYTKIKLLDGRVLTMQQLAQIYEDEPKSNLQVLTFDFQLNRFVPTNIKWCSKTRLNAQMIRVHLDNETYVDVTPDHKFILNDGSLKQADKLQQGDSLLSIQNEIKVVFVQKLQERMDTYNLQVEHKDHNILLHDNGIVVKQSTLSSLDIVLSRFIENLQSLFVSELYRIVLIHLFIIGYRDLDHIDFKLQLNNPSSVKKLQDLQLWRQKISIAQDMQSSGHFSLNFIYDNIYQLSADASKKLLKQIVSDHKYRAKVEKMVQDIQNPADEQEYYQDDQYQEQGEQYQQDQTQQQQMEQETTQTQQTLDELKPQKPQSNPLQNKFIGNTPLNVD